VFRSLADLLNLFQSKRVLSSLMKVAILHSHWRMEFTFQSLLQFADLKENFLQSQTKGTVQSLKLSSFQTPHAPTHSKGFLRFPSQRKAPAPPYLSPLCRCSAQVPYWLSRSGTSVSVSLASGGSLEKHFFSWSCNRTVPTFHHSIALGRTLTRC